jgi:hypothetical protein
MTPKIIHYVWVGDAPKPPIVLKCIESWRKFCPGWEIREWGNDILSEIDNRYVQEAFRYKKWAFVADWLRLYVLKEYGGFYLDTDMEILKPIDEFCVNKLTMGLVDRNEHVFINGGFIGSEKGNEIINEILSLYDDISFLKSNGELDQTTNVARMADYFAVRWNLKPCSAFEEISLGSRQILYPHDYFLSKKGYTYHHYCASWVDAWQRKVWLSFGKYKLVRFKRRKEVSKGDPKLLNGEIPVFHLCIGKRKRLILLKTDALKV